MPDKHMVDDGKRNVWLSSLGGSGENGRNCHMIGWDDGCILLDCGVRRETSGNAVGGYPHLTAEIVSRIRAVFLSHCHEDHTAALPLLYRLGYTGPVYGTEETIRQTPVFIRKWMEYVRRNGGSLPYDEADCEKLCFVPLELGKQTAEGIELRTGRSGHVCGAVWYLFSIGGREILYTGDLCLHPQSLALDAIPTCDAVIADCAYAGRTIPQQAQYAALLRALEETAAQGGSVLLPVPAKGRGIDLLRYLDRAWHGTPVYAEAVIAESMEALAQQREWTVEDYTADLSPNTVVLRTESDRQTALKRDGVFLVTDGMLTTEQGKRWLDALKGRAENRVIITGHAAKGTPAADIFEDVYRRSSGVQASAKRITIKVHPDEADLCRLAEQTGAKELLLFHGEESLTGDTAEHLKKVGVQTAVLRYPARMELR